MGEAMVLATATRGRGSKRRAPGEENSTRTYPPRPGQRLVDIEKDDGVPEGTLVEGRVGGHCVFLVLGSGQIGVLGGEEERSIVRLGGERRF